MAKSTNSSLKTKAWNAFSKYRRIERCLETTGLPFVGVCITCYKRFHISALQCGHCFAGRSNVKLLNRKFTDCQCVICNETFHGREKRFRKAMNERYGEEYVDRQAARFKRIIIQDKRINWELRAERYVEAYKRAMRKHGYKTYSEMLQASR